MRHPEIVGYVNNENEVHVQFKQSDEACDLRLVNFGHHRTPPGYTYGPLMRDFALIHFIVSGHGYMLVDGTRYNLSGGQVFLFRPNQIHYYESDPTTPWEYYYIGFAGNSVPEILSDAGFTQNVAGRTLVGMNSLFPHLKALCDTANEPLRPLLQQGHLYQILHHLIRCSQADSEIVTQSGGPQASPNYAHTASGILHHSFAERNITVDTLAQQLGISTGYLNSLFRAQFGKSVYQYLLEHRIKKACELLTMTSKPIKRIAMEVGYDDSLYFSRVFTKHAGMTPSRYREQNTVKRRETV
jgi:AraC-type DNA-binding domain-containing proteins